jgi:outer membrane protein W
MRRFVFVCTLLLAVSLSAQSNHVTLLVNSTAFSSTSTSDPDIGAVKLTFDSHTGYGVAFDHFLSPDLAFRASAERLRAASRLEFPDQGGVSVSAGSLDLTEYTAGFHWYFLSRSVVRPYAGAGVARIQGGKLHIPGDFTDSGLEETISLDSKTTWNADAGIDIATGANGAVVLNVRYTPYKTHFGAAPDDPLQFMKLNPVTFGAGFRWKF